MGRRGNKNKYGWDDFVSTWGWRILFTIIFAELVWVAYYEYNTPDKPQPQRVSERHVCPEDQDTQLGNSRLKDGVAHGCQLFRKNVEV